MLNEKDAILKKLKYINLDKNIRPQNGHIAVYGDKQHELNPKPGSSTKGFVATNTNTTRNLGFGDFVWFSAGDYQEILLEPYNIKIILVPFEKIILALANYSN